MSKTDKRITAAKQVLKRGKGIRSFLSYSYIDKNNRQYLCDGFVCVELHDPILELPNLPESEKHLDYLYILPVVFPKGKMIELPDKALLRAYIKRRRKDLRAKGDISRFVAYDFGEGYPIVNAQYLLELLELLPSARLANFYGTNKGIFVSCQDGRGVLLPLSVRSDLPRYRTELREEVISDE